MIPSNHCQQCGNKHPGQECATNPTVIQWKYGGQQVYVYGSWSHFQVGTKMRKTNEPPYFHSVALSLTVGTYEYKFYVDGQWVFDNADKKVSDNFGGFNNQITVIPKTQIQTESDDQETDDCPAIQYRHAAQNSIRVKIKTTMDGSEIFVRGSWDNWSKSIQLTRRYLTYAETFENYCNIQVQPAQYEYKFIISNQWVHDPSLPSVQNQQGSYNNVINIKRKQGDLKVPHIDVSKVYWSQYKLNNLKFDRISGHSISRVGNYFYVFGGQCTGTFSDKLYRLNTKLHSLEIVYNTIGQTPDSRAYHNAIAYGSKIIFFGGLNWHEVFDEYFVLNTSTMEWTYSNLGGEIPQTRERATLTLMGKEDILIYFGGYYCTPDLEVEQVFNDVYCLNLKKMSWNKPLLQGDQPAPRYAHTATQLQEKMYVFGGQNTSQNLVDNTNFNDVWMLDLTAGKTRWIDLTNQIKGEPPKPRHGHTANLLQKHIVYFGGRGNSSKELFNDVYVLDTVNLEWTKPEIKGTQPAPRYYHTAGLYDDQIWVLGGNTGKWLNQHVYRLSFTEEGDDSSQPRSNHFKHDVDEDSSSDEEYLTKLRKTKQVEFVEESKSQRE